MTNDKKGYSAKVAEAEAAVRAVKDPELRRVAFEKVLADLLHGETAKPEPTHRKREGEERKKVAEPKVAANPKGKARAKRGGGPMGQIMALVDEGWFKKQRTIGEVRAELGTRGFHIPRTSLSPPLQRLTRQKVLRRQKVGVEGKNKSTFAYSNW